MLELGLLAGLGLLVTLQKAPPKIRLIVLSHPTKVDIGILVLLLCLHWGTFSGVMVATIGAFVCSLILSLGRKIYGYYGEHEGKKLYFPGLIDMSEKLA